MNLRYNSNNIACYESLSLQEQESFLKERKVYLKAELRQKTDEIDELVGEIESLEEHIDDISYDLRLIEDEMDNFAGLEPDHYPNEF